jgi:hypothetical protein
MPQLEDHSTFAHFLKTFVWSLSWHITVFKRQGNIENKAGFCALPQA